MKIRENNLIEICKEHGFVYNVIIYDHDKPARQSKVACRCNEFDASLEAKLEKYECKIKNCRNRAECIFSKYTEPDKQKLKRPIFWKFHKLGKKLYACIHYNWNGEMPNE
jgi:hypothetical protein